jgi:hypothetical protein
MSIETYERLVGKCELYKLLDEGLDAVKQGKVIRAEDAFYKLESNKDK